MKKCIWCSKDENNTTFDKKAHTIPKSLGGVNICDNVCDNCNTYFGNRCDGLPAIELVLKEFFHLSQYLLLGAIHEPTRHKSVYFNFNKQKKQLTLKPKYSVKQSFQMILITQFKRGIYKVFLEERERQCKDADDNRFDFIREFSRYGLNDYPIFYVKPFSNVILFQTDDTKHPAIRFTEYSENLDKQFRMYEYTILGHRIAIPTSKAYNLNLDSFIKYIDAQDARLAGNELIELKKISDIDFLFSHLK